MKNRRAWFLLICAVFLGLRIALLLFSSDVYFVDDERFMGTIAKSVLDGCVIPPLDYQYHPHEGGTLLFGLSAVPFFALFGDSYLSLKLAALAWAFAALLLWAAYARRCAGGTAALFTALFLCFAPPNLVRLGLWAMGTQPQCPLLDIAVLASFAILLGSPSPRAGGDSGRTASAALLFGFACGFAIYYSFLSAIAVAACLLCWPADRGRSLTPLSGGMFAAGLAAGAAPLLLHSLHTGTSAFRRILQEVSDVDAPLSLAGSAGTFLRMLLVDREWMNGRMPAPVAQGFQLVYAAGVVAAVAAFLSRGRRGLVRWWDGLRRGARGGAGALSPLAPAALYLVLFPLLFVSLHIDRRLLDGGRMLVAYRFFALYHPFLAFALALAAARLWDSGRQAARDATRSACILAAFFCVIPLALEMRAGRPWVGTRTPGYSYFTLGWNFAQKEDYWTLPDRGLLLSERIPVPERDDYLRGFTEARWWEAVEEGRGPGDAAEALREVERTAFRADPKFVPFFYSSLGRVLAIQYLFEERRGLGPCLALARQADPRHFGDVVRGIGQALASRDAWIPLAPAVAARIPPAQAAAFARGVEEGRGFRYYHSVYER